MSLLPGARSETGSAFKMRKVNNISEIQINKTKKETETQKAETKEFHTRPECVISQLLTRRTDAKASTNISPKIMKA
jgi:hypothetical protein